MDTPRDSKLIVELILRAQDGDTDAFTSLIEMYTRPLCVAIGLEILHRGHAYAEMDDVWQETIVRAWRSLPAFKAEHGISFFSWLGTIATQVIRDLLQGNLPRTPYIDESNRGHPCRSALPKDLLTMGLSSPSQLFSSNESLKRLMSGWCRLKPDQREVVLLFFVERLTAKEVAARMHRSPDACSMLLRRALRKWRDDGCDTDGEGTTAPLPKAPRTYGGRAHLDQEPPGRMASM